MISCLCRKRQFFAYFSDNSACLKFNVDFFGDSSMSRKRSRKCLYEVSNEAKKARKSGSILEITKRARAFSKKNVAGSDAKSKVKTTASRPDLPKRSLFALRRLMSFSVKKAVILLVVFALVVLFWPFGGKQETEPQGGEPEGVRQEKPEIVEPVGPEQVQPGGGENGQQEVVVVPGPPKDHYIVIASHTDVEQLKMLASHFMLNGIETEYKVSGKWHTLITKDRYLKPGDGRSKIDQAKSDIKKIGGEYEPPDGYKPFKFDDIYERKVR